MLVPVVADDDVRRRLVILALAVHHVAALEVFPTHLCRSIWPV